MSGLMKRRREREFGLNPHFDGAAGKPDPSPAEPTQPADAKGVPGTGEPTKYTTEELSRALLEVLYPRGIR